MKKIWVHLLFTIPIATLASFIFTATSRAQITPDRSLGAESSVVNPNAVIKGLPSTQIDGGATRGTNLFHSFQEFNVQAGRGAYFSNPAGIQNILSRVTGSNVSNIFGKLGVLGNANLFFINPNGIIFGPSSSLDVNGSFFGSTANSIVFPNGFEFSATNPQAPPLLTVNIPIGLRFRDNPQDITVKGQGLGQEVFNKGELVGAVDSFTSPTLEVSPGKTLALVGGNVNLDGGLLQAPRGLVELGGLASAGTVGINSDSSLSFPQGVQLADVSLINKAGINVIAKDLGGGSININARNLGISGQSLLTAGIAENLGEVKNQAGNTPLAGDITLNTTGETRIDQSRIENNVNSGTTANSGNITITSGSVAINSDAQISSSTFGTGNAGNITITSGSVAINSDAQISSSTFGTGNAGNVVILAKDLVSLDNGDILSNVESGAVGNGGNISITAASLSLRDSGQLQALVRQKSDNQPAGMGNAGNINIDVTGSVTIAGIMNPFRSEIFSNVETGAVGHGGDINISAGSLSITDGGRLDASTAGKGDAGNVKINVSGPVTISGVKDGSRSEIFSNAEMGAMGNGGNITISAGSFSITDGGRLEASTNGQGRAGNVTVHAKDSVSLVNGDIFSNVESGAVGNGGNISITAASLSLRDSGQLQALVRQKSDNQPAGMGNAGNINIDVTGSVTIAGIMNPFRSEIFSNVETGAVGHGGDINISAGSLSITDGGRLDASTAGKGDAGNVKINVSGPVTISGVKDGSRSEIFSNAEMGAMGNGGNITISAGSFSITDGGRLEASTNGQGRAGNVTVHAKDSVSLVNGDIFSNVESGAIGNGGNISITAASLSLTDSAQLQTLVRGVSGTLLAGRGNAGNVNIDVTGLVSIAGVSNGSPSGIFSLVNTGATGNSGDINITSGFLSLTNGGQLVTGNSGQGNAGNINFNVLNTATFAGVNSGFTSGAFSDISSGGVGHGGNINVTTGSLFLTKGAELQASTFGRGDSGNVTIKADTISFDGVGSTGFASGAFSAVASGGVGHGGNINVTTGSLSLTRGAALQASTFGQGDSGNVTIKADTISFDGIGSNGFASGAFSNVGNNREHDAVGNGGNVTVTARSLSLTNGAELTASTFAKGNAGNVIINTDTVFLDGVGNGTGNNRFSSQVSSGVQPEAVGIGGNISITARSLTVQNGAEVSVSSPQSQAGNLTITAKNIRLDQGSLTAETGATSGGNITLKGLDLLLLRNNSLISAQATTNTANAGDITILAPNGFVVAARGGKDGSDIVTKASRGQGGNISITSQRVFGLAERRSVPGNGTNDIDASSQVDAKQGRVNINSPDVDPSRGLVELPVNVVDPTTLIAQNPCQRGIDSSFTITGRGGLPSNPNQLLASDNVRIDLVKPTTTTSNSPTTSAKLPLTTPTVKRLVPAQGWIFNDKGQVLLTAYDPTNTGSQRSWQEPASCAKR